MRQAVLAVVIAALLVGCRGTEIVSGVSDSAFVRAMVALRQLPTGTSLDTVVRARSRDSILRTEGITAAQLESAAVRLAGQPERAAKLWRAIESAAVPPSAR